MSHTGPVSDYQDMLDQMKSDWNTEIQLILNLAKATNCTTLLHHAAALGSDDIARPPLDLESPVDRKLIVGVFMEAGAKIDAAVADDEIALNNVLQSEMEDLKVVETLLLKAKSETSPTEELIEKLLAAKCPFAYFVLLRDVEILENLLQRGFNVNCYKNFAEKTALLVAVLIDDRKLAELLVDRGADVNAGDAYEGGPVYYAAKLANPDMLQFLLEHGANPEPEVDFVGLMPMSVCLYNRETDDERVRECAELLLDYGDFWPLTRTLIEELQMHYNEILQTSRLNCLVARQALINTFEEQKYEEGQHLTTFDELKKYYGECREILEVVVAGKMKLVDLLWDDSEREIRLRARDHTFVRQVEQFCSQPTMKDTFSYYARILRSQIAEAVRVVELEKEASLVVCALFKCDYNQLSIFARQVVGYLSERDLEQLCRL